jgi:hypothetical protein
MMMMMIHICIYNVKLAWKCIFVYILQASRSTSLCYWKPESFQWNKMVYSVLTPLQHIKFTVCQSVYQHTIQINQPTRCNDFSSLLLEIYVQLNMFRSSSRPSSEATTNAVATSGLPLELGDNSAVGRGRAGGPAWPRPTALVSPFALVANSLS